VQKTYAALGFTFGIPRQLELENSMDSYPVECLLYSLTVQPIAPLVLNKRYIHERNILMKCLAHLCLDDSTLSRPSSRSHSPGAK